MRNSCRLHVKILLTYTTRAMRFKLQCVQCDGVVLQIHNLLAVYQRKIASVPSTSQYLFHMQVKYIMFFKLYRPTFRTRKMHMTFQFIHHNYVLVTKRIRARDHLHSTVTRVIATCVFQMKTSQNC